MAVLTTNRLTLTPLAPQDANELFEVRGDPDAMAFWDAFPDPDPSVTATVVAHLLQEMAAGDALHWTARLRSDGTFAGVCDLSDLREPGSADIGFMIVRRLWGRGLAGEIVTCLLDEARRRDLTSIRARIHTANERSARVLRRAGFLEVETIAAFEIRPGVYCACTRFEMQL
jgi:RimJ/RimL family protein N-acetyltransferase